MDLEIRAFGTFRVLGDGEPLDLGARLPADLLALLVLAETEAVDHDVLADRLWRGTPPASSRATLQGYVARLRRVLEPGRSARDATVLVTRGNGYALEISRAHVDVHRFTDLVGQARRAVAEGRLEPAVETLEGAVGLWAGAPYAGIADVMDAAPDVARLEDLRLLAIEELTEASLALGRGAERVPELAALAVRHPLRERMQLILARAMYAGGRQAEALDTLRATRTRMADELGLDPSAELRELESAILNHEVDQTWPRRMARTVDARPSNAAVRSAPTDGFVGRRHELEHLAAGWQQAGTGQGCAVVVTGEPGIGKTRLVEAFLARTGAPARWARCLQTPGVPPYWPWQQVLGGLPDTSGASDEGARFAFALDVARRLQDDVSEAPAVVVLDDIQWADPDSLQVLQVVLELLTGTSLLVVMTCRDVVDPSPALAAVMAAAARVPHGRRLALEPMAPDEVTELVREVRGREAVGASLGVTEVVRRSGGNPLFAAELSRLDATAAVVVPTVARDLIRMRITALPSLAQDLIALLSVAGRELPVGQLAHAVSRPVAEVDDPLAVATSSGLVVETESGRLRMRHDLVRETVLAELLPGQRAELNARLADLLESSPGAGTSRAAIAVHRSEAAAGAADVRAADACRVAAQEALDRAGAAEAADLALRGLAHVPPHEQQLRGDLLHLRGTALRRLGLIEDSLSALGEEARIARRLGDHARFARAALAAGGAMGGYWATAVAPAVVDAALLEEAVAQADALDDRLASDVRAALAVHRAAGGRDAIALADAAERTGAGPLAAVAGFVARWSTEFAPERLVRARALLERSRGHAVTEATSLHLLRCALVENLHAEEASAVSARFSAAVQDRGDGDMILLDLWTRSALALAEGRYGVARALADQAVESAPSASPAAADVIRVSRQTVEGIIAWHERSLGEVVPEVVDLAATVDSDWLAVMALAHAQAGRHEECLRVADRVLQLPGAGARAPVHTILLADAYIELGDADRARTLLPALQSYGDTNVVLWPGMTFLGPTALYRGGIKAVLGDPGAEDELRTAVAICERFGYEPFRRRAERLLR